MMKKLLLFFFYWHKNIRHVHLENKTLVVIQESHPITRKVNA